MSDKTALTYSCVIVEDDDASRLILENYISRIEFLELKASLRSGKEGFSFLINNPDIDILLLDINMPRLDGIGLLGRIKAHPALGGIPAVFQTGACSTEDTIVGLRAGAYYYLTKPYEHDLLLAVVDGLKGYHDAERHPEGRHVPGLLLYRFDAPLFFANSRFFVEDLVARIDAAAEPVRTVVVTAEPITDIDVTAAEALKGLLADLEARGVELRFSELKGHVRDRLLRYGFDGIDPQAHFARTTGEAVKTYVRDTGTEWVDWEDRPQ